MDTADNNVTPSPRWIHYLAIAAGCATFPLVIVGGLVTTTRVGMADAVWPTPPWYFVWMIWVGRAMERGLGFLIEHGHRQLGWIVGLLTLILAGCLWFRELRPWLRWLGVIALVGVIVQGVLGGLRVILISQTLALVHGVFAQAFFALMVCLAAFTGRGWADRVTPRESSDAARLQRLALTTTAFVLLQLIFGATLRHLGVPWALAAHLVVAFVVVVHVGLLAKRIFVQHADQPKLVRSIEVLGGLMLGQLMLGAGAWGTSSGFGLNETTAASGAQVFFATAHVSVGALILAICVLLTAQSYRLLAAPADQGPRRRDRESSPASSRGGPAPLRPTVSALESRELWTAEVHA